MNREAMKRLILISLMTVFTFVTNAQELRRGYRGFIDWTGSIAPMEYTLENRKTAFFTGASTSHGFQFNRNFYLGAGFGIENSSKFHHWTAPLFAEAHTDQYWGKLTMFGSMRIGINCFDGGGFYLSPTIGYRQHIFKKLNANFGIGLTLISLNNPKFKREFGSNQQSTVFAWTEHKPKLFFSFRVGIDF